MPLKLHLVFTFKVKGSGIRFFKPAVKHGRGFRPPRAIWDKEGIVIYWGGRTPQLRIRMPKGVSMRRLRRSLRDFARSNGGDPNSLIFYFTKS